MVNTDGRSEPRLEDEILNLRLRRVCCNRRRRQRCADTVFNIRILSVSIKNYPYSYPIRIHGYIMVQLHRESKKISTTISTVASTSVARF